MNEIPSPRPAPFRAPPVGWYDPGQLLRTAGQVGISTVFARNADWRITETLLAPAGEVFDFTSHAGLTLDYVSDAGDGWNPTYAVAYWVTRPLLPLTQRDGGEPELETRRGEILVFGGDEVYPCASREAYEQRLVAPYAAAGCETHDPLPTVFAIPGNHDWYDSLVSFSQLFVARKRFASWKTAQGRSYFSLKLPGGWWLAGVDIQLDSDIDVLQLAYFEEVAARMGPDDRVILATAEPHWVYEHERSHPSKRESASRNLSMLENRVFAGRVRVWLAGDQHHYRRHATPDGRRHKITAGGGGAFLHPTHGWNDRTPLAGGFRLEAAFPSRRTSRRLAWGNLAFLSANPAFGVLTGSLYVLLFINLRDTLGGLEGRPLWQAPFQALDAALEYPGALFWILATLVGFWAFTDTSSRKYKAVAGPIHGLSHLTAAFFVSWGVRSLTAPFELGGGLPRHVFLELARVAAVFAAGWVVGSFLMGAYLLCSLNLFRRHRNEAFSSLKIQDYKSFLRLVIEPDGDLVIHAVGLDKVPRTWDEPPGRADGEARLVPGRAARDLRPFLIEPPIRVKA